MTGGTNLKTWVVMSVFLLGMDFTTAAGRAIYVDDDGPADFNTIQAAIDDSNDSDTIIVLPGLYFEVVRFNGKNIHVTSTKPRDSNVVASTVIEYGVGFAGTEDPNCTLEGFKINFWINGRHTHATMSHCLLSNSGLSNGIAISSFDGTISNCVIVGNRPSGDAIAPAIFKCQGLIKNCTIAHNGDGIGVGKGGTMTIENCIIYGNLWSQISVPREGKVNILYSNVEWGLGGIPHMGNVNWGPGNIDKDPCFVQPGYWDVNSIPGPPIPPPGPHIPPSPPPPPPDSQPGAALSYTWVEGDYHLLPGSPCIDAGDPNYVVEPNQTDLDGRPRIIGGRIDMGAYEYSPPISAEVRIVPRTINLQSKGKWIIAFIWLPKDYNVTDIDPNSILLEDEIQPDRFSVDEQEQIAIAKFSREELRGILSIGNIELTITGQLIDGTVFGATNIIRVIDKGGRRSAK